MTLFPVLFLETIFFIVKVMCMLENDFGKKIMVKKPEEAVCNFCFICFRLFITNLMHG